MEDDDPNLFDVDKLTSIYQPDGTVMMVLPRELLQRGMMPEDIRDAAQQSLRFKATYDVAQAAREAGMSEAVISEAIDEFRRRRGE